MNETPAQTITSTGPSRILDAAKDHPIVFITPFMEVPCAASPLLNGRALPHTLQPDLPATRKHVAPTDGAASLPVRHPSGEVIPYRTPGKCPRCGCGKLTTLLELSPVRFSAQCTRCRTIIPVSRIGKEPGTIQEVSP
jgi:hypothetical protein